MNPGIILFIKNNWKTILLVLIVAFILTIVAGFLVGYFGLFLPGVGTFSATDVHGFSKSQNNNTEISGNEGSYTGGYVSGEDCLNKINSNAKKYVEKVNEAVKKYGTDPALMLAQLTQESGFNPSAQSYVGAQGIAQFMPGTWSAVAAKYDIDGNSNGKESAWEAEDGIYAQAAYNVDIYNTLKPYNLATTENIIAGYNAGPGAVIKYRGIPPYEETRNYVKIIMSLYSSYKQCIK